MKETNCSPEKWRDIRDFRMRCSRVASGRQGKARWIHRGCGRRCCYVRGGKDVLLSIPDESIVPYCLESMVSAICVAGTYEGNNRFKLTVCVTVILKVLAQVEILIPSYGFCPIPPCEEFAENVCDEFFSLPLFPPASLCNNDEVSISNAACNTGNCGCGCGCRR